MTATGLLWDAAGRPTPCGADGVPVPRRGGGFCAACGAPAEYALGDTISDNFTSVKNASRAWAWGGHDVCASCVFATRTLRLRCAGWFASARGVEWWRTRPTVTEWWASRCRHWPAERPDVLATLFAPPEPPFVAALPLAGIAHGGEANIHRTWWPGETAELSRLQAKHVAIYARVATSQERYPLQVDDQHDIVVDVPLWSRLRPIVAELIADMRECGVRWDDLRTALRTLLPPPRSSAVLTRTWRMRVEPLRPHHRASWWGLFVGVV